MNNIIDEIAGIVSSGGLLTGAEVSSRSAGSWGKPGNIHAKAIIRPGSTEEVAAIMKACHRAGQTVVVHGGLTNIVQSATSTADDVVLSLELMNRIEEIDTLGRTMMVQAGVVLQTIHERAAKEGLMFPLDLGARGSCQIGGNIATNAGGTRVIRYGMTRDLVMGLEVVLPDGTILSSLDRMLKNNAGYDLKHLFVGSEGTLGVVTRAVLKLQEQPKSHNTAFIALPSFDKLIALLRFMDGALGGTLSAFEVMWRNYYELVTTKPAPHQPPLQYTHPYYALLESLGANAKEDTARFHRALEAAVERGLVADAVISQTQAQRQALWEMRDDVRQVYRFSSVFLFDVSLPLREMERYVAQIKSELNAAWEENRCFVFGHLGDGNLHISVVAGKNDDSTQRKVEEIVYGPLRQIGGSVSAEHGIGLQRKRYLGWCRSESHLATMRSLKTLFDPKGILNPGKVIDVTPTQ